MKKYLLVILISCLTALSASPYTRATPLLPTNPSVYSAPLTFTENKGQILTESGKLRTDILFSGRKKGVTFFLTKKGIIYTWTGKQSGGYAARQVHMELLGSNPDVQIQTENQVKGVNNYFNSAYPNGITQVKSYLKVIYREVYPNIDFVIYSNGIDLKYDFIVKPGGDPQSIRFTYKGNKQLKLQKNGSLLITNPIGKLIEGVPFTYQQAKGDTTQIISAFRLENNVVYFTLGNYNSEKPLIIDPSIAWATSYGGNEDDISQAVATDASGNIFLTGSTNSLTATGLTTTNVYKQTFEEGSSGEDAFLTKFNPQGERVWSTYYGGPAKDKAVGIAVDKNGNIYIAGETSSSTNISLNPTGATVQQPTYGGAKDGFLAKFDTNGQPVWCTYYGGSKEDIGAAVSVDTNNNVYLSGHTRSENAIAFNGFKSYHGTTGTQNELDAFLVKFTSSGQRVWGTYYGGDTRDLGSHIAMDPTNPYLYLSGYTASQSIVSFNVENISQVTNGNTSFQPTKNSDFDVYIAKFDLNGNVIWGTYYGGNGLDQNDATVVDKEGNVYLCGSTRSNESISSLNQPLATLNNTNRDSFIAKFSSTGERIWATYVGGELNDFIQGVQIDKNEKLVVAGTTYSTQNMFQDGFQDNLKGENDAFITGFDPASGQRLWSSYYGANDNEWCNDMAIDQEGNLYLTGNTTSSTGFARNVSDHVFGGSTDVFLIKLDDIAPRLSTLTPLNNTIYAGITPPLEIVFSEYIYKGTGTIKIMEGNVPTEIPVSDPRVVITGNKVTINLSSLSVNEIRVMVSADAFKDLAGNFFSGIATSEWVFTNLPEIIITPESFEPIPVKHTGAELTYENISTLSIQLSPIPEGTTVKLYTRGISDADSDWQIESITAVNNTYEKNIPLAKIDKIGLEYYFEVSPPVQYGPTFSSDTGIVYINYQSGLDIPMQRGSSQNQYQLVSIPLTLQDSSVSQVFNFLGEPNIEKWRFYRYKNDGNSAAYEEYINTPDFTSIETGRAYWILSRDGNNFASGPGTTLKVRQAKPYTIHLQPGWNLIGNPYDMVVSWDSVQTANKMNAPELRELITYNGVYESGDLKRYSGGFVWADNATSINIPVLRDKTINGRLSTERPLHDKNSVLEVNFTLESNTMRYRLGGLGMHPSASSGKDRYDRYLLPRFTDYLEIRFASEIEKTPGFTKQMVPVADEYTWEFTVETNQPSQLTELKWENYIPAPDGRQLYLYDVQQETIINMLDQQKYTFHSGTSTLFRVYYGSPLYISKHLRPQRIKLNQNIPNPFRGETLIPFSLPDGRSEYTVEVSIYNTTGANVSELARGEYQPGFHQLTWNGKDAQGNSLPAGLYIARLVVADEKQTKEMFIRIIIQ